MLLLLSCQCQILNISVERLQTQIFALPECSCLGITNRQMNSFTKRSATVIASTFFIV